MTHRPFTFAITCIALLAACSGSSPTSEPVESPPSETDGPTPSATPSNSTSNSTVATSSEEPPATMVLRNGVIWTGVDGKTATALAMTDETITAVGSDAEIELLIGDDTEVVDLAGRLVVPGLIDAHVHVVAGAAESSKCTFEDQQLTLTEMAPIVTACLEDQPGGPDDWFQVVSVNPAGLEATATDIDALVSDRPAFFSSADGHIAWVNTAGLAAAGIVAATPDPATGEIERDAAGNPTGRLLDEAIGLVSSLIPTQTPADYAAATAKSLEGFSALGITALRDPSVSGDVIGVYESLLADDALPVRIATSFTLQDMTLPTDELVASVEEFIDAHPGASGRLATDQVKVFADGVIEAPTWTASLLQPYLDELGAPTENSGELYYDPAVFPEQVTALHEAGISVHVHAVGDLAVQTALDAFEYASENDGDADLPDQIVHLQLIDPSDYGRFSENDVIAGFQPDWLLRESYTVEALEPFVGPERYSRLYPLRSVADAGATLAGGSDWPVSTYNPFEAIQRAVTRRDVESAEPLVADQAITVEQALTMYTVGSGAAMPFPGLGILAPGNPADIAVLSQNILEIDPYTIENTVSELTVVGGKVVHEAK
jgi:predicted amidohydrolase YtcJ